jgi:dipeptidyl aminopeptidase/acylaminoacyl peptidase
MRINLNVPEKLETLVENISGYDLSSKGLFYFKLPEGIVYKTNFEGSNNPEQMTISPPDDMTDNSYQIIIYDENRIVFFNNSHKLYIYNKGEQETYFQKISDSALGSQFSDDGKKLLFWNDREISVYFFRKWEVQPTRNENELMSITRFSDEIKNIQWTRDYEHILFTNNKKIKIIELDNRDKRNMMDVLSLKDDTSILVANFADGKLYYTEKNDRGQNNMHAIFFPEQVTFLTRIQGR